MSKCLSDYELWLAQEGEGQSGDLAHLRACPACIARRRRLVRDLSAITSALRGPAPLPRSREIPGWRRWSLAAAIAGACVLFAGLESAMWQHSKAIVAPPPPGAQENRDVFDDVAAMLSPSDSVSLAALPSDDVNLDDDTDSIGADGQAAADVNTL